MAVTDQAQQVRADELAALLAAGYLRLLDTRKGAQDGQNPLDSPEQESDELAMTTSRRPRRA